MTQDQEAIVALTAERDQLRADCARYVEYIAASKECAEAQEAIALHEENEQMRLAITQAVDNINRGASVHSGFCTWCNEKWLHLDGATFEEINAEARRHAYRCKSNPLKLERDAACEERDALKLALRVALKLVEDGPERVWPDGAWGFSAEQCANVAKLRRLCE